MQGVKGTDDKYLAHEGDKTLASSNLGLERGERVSVAQVCAMGKRGQGRWHPSQTANAPGAAGAPAIETQHQTKDGGRSTAFCIPKFQQKIDLGLFLIQWNVKLYQQTDIKKRYTKQNKVASRTRTEITSKLITLSTCRQVKTYI